MPKVQLSIGAPMMRAYLWLAVGAVLSVVAPDGSIAQTDVAIEEIRLLARPLWHPSFTKPQPAAEDLPGVWSPSDREDSIVVEVKVRLPESALERAMLVADVRVAVARAVAQDPEDPESFLDWETMYSREVWLPSSQSFAVPVAEGERVSAGRHVLTLGHVNIESIRDELYRRDRRLIVTHLRVTAALLAEQAEDYTAEHFVERTIKILTLY